MQIAPFATEHSAYRPVMQVAYSAGMANDSPRQTRRRANLKALLGEDVGAQAQLADEIGTPRSHLSAILASRRGVGDTLAAKIEQHFGKPAGWLDSDHAAAWPFSSELLAKVATLQARDLHLMEVAMWAHLREDVPESVAETAKRQLRSLGAGVKSVTPAEQTRRTN